MIIQFRKYKYNPFGFIIRVILFLGVLFVSSTIAQSNSACDHPEHRQFDFWLGDWNLSWKSGQGENHISSILDGCVIQEEFNGNPAIPLKGMSLSTYNKITKQWQQTWVDNSGGYLDFKGEFKDDKMILSREAVQKGKPIMQRMVWYNITSDSLDWNWERSLDKGQSWQVLWHIHYTRE